MTTTTIPDLLHDAGEGCPICDDLRAGDAATRRLVARARAARPIGHTASDFVAPRATAAGAGGEP